MNERWTLNVEDFGKIEKASVRIAPLICFVGDNNSGKSYLLSLLWGILILGKDCFPKTPPESKTYKRCENWLRSHIGEETQLDQEEFAMYVEWFNSILMANRKDLVRRIFNADIHIGSISISDYKRAKQLSILWSQDSVRYSFGQTSIRFPHPGEKSGVQREELLRMNAYICWNILMGGIAEPLFTPIVRGRRIGEPVYLPASRTGFMLTYPQLVSQSLQTAYNLDAGEHTSSLTLPYIDFLQLITMFDRAPSIPDNKRKIADFIETNLTSGKVSVRKDGLPVIRYTPNGSADPLPLHIASSIVTEVSPLLLLFKSNIKFNSLIIEEPEAHLHPGLQMKMARLIINISNAGIPVWITTHSEAILQQINNMLKLSANKDRKRLMQEYGYQEEDLLDADDIEMYQFGIGGSGRTVLEKLNRTPYGFEVPTFNSVLAETIQEVRAFQEEE